MIYKCPGSQRFSQPQPDNIKCPFCGKDVEIWSDEPKATCTGCAKDILREEGATCLDWCKYAKECVGDTIYSKYMQNKTRTLKEKLIKDLEEYFGNDQKRIKHAKKVMDFSEELLRVEKADWHIVIPASILHDVGIKVGEEKNLQEKEGPKIAKKILLKHGFKKEDIEEICEIIAYHHTPGKINSLNFKVLYDADQLVNLKDDIKTSDKKEIKKIIEKVFLTDNGKKKAEEIYLK